MKLVIMLAIAALIILCCVLLNNASSKVGLPVLLAFIVLGMIVGNNTIMPLTFNDYNLAGDVCTAALIFIMFYGGFGTNWKSARKIATEAGVLASLGVVITAAVTGLLCHFILGWGWLESLLMGSVVSSTDAASAFSILRSRKLGLKNNEAPLIEVESGSNDPLSYMLTVVMISLIQGEAAGGQVAWMLFKQIAFGAGIGLLISRVAVRVMSEMHFATSGFDSLFVLAIAILSYAIPSMVGGNGYLSAYIVGIYLGNSDFTGKKTLVGFFDGVTDLMMVIIFFILGLLSTPSDLLATLGPAVIIFLCITLVARPVAVWSILRWFRKYPLNQIGFISFTGLRGAASIVFAIMVMTSGAETMHDIFSVVFCIVLISIALQGSLIPYMAGKLGVVDPDANVMTTFNDFASNNDMQFSEIAIAGDSAWKNRLIKDLKIPRNLLFCLVVKADGNKVLPNGDTILEEGDTAILCTKECRNDHTVKIVEHPISKRSKWIGRRIKEYPKKDSAQILLIRRGDDTVIPNGDTVLRSGDILYINMGAATSRA